MDRSIRMLVPALVLAGTYTAALAGSPRGLRPPESYAPAVEFDRLDANADGRIDRAEARDNGRVERDFRRMDASRDGAVDAMEFAAFENGAPANRPVDTSDARESRSGERSRDRGRR